MPDKDPVDKWAREYRAGGIPSSTRDTPSGAVVWAVGKLKHDGVALRTALDIGCGKGRNSIFLARQGMQVTAMDFTPDAVRHLQEAATKEGLAERIRAIPHDVTDAWPVAEASMDLIVDAFCFKHISAAAARQTYRMQMLRALRARGHYLISFASIGDGYYGQYVVEKTDREEMLVNDPANGIQSVLFSKKRVMQFFSPEMVLLEELHDTAPSVMHGKDYARSAYALLMARNPHMV